MSVSRLKRKLLPLAALTMLAVMMTCLYGCRHQSEKMDPPGYSQNVSAEGLDVSLTTSTQEISSSQMLDVTLTVRYPQQYKVSLPEIPDKWGGLIVYATRDEPEVMGADLKVQVSRTYTLEPDLVGRSRLEPLAVVAINDKGQSIKVECSSIEMTVLSVLGQGDRKMRDIAPDQPELADLPPSKWRLVFVGFNVLVVTILICVWLKWRRRLPVNTITSSDGVDRLSTLPPDELLQQLEPTLVRVVSNQNGLELESHDFSGLQKALIKKGEDVGALRGVIARYEKLYYGHLPVSEDDVTELLARLDRYLMDCLNPSDLGKECPS